MSVVYLKPGREKSLLRRHPWVFSGAVASVQGSPGDGNTVQILSSRGEFIAWAAYSSQSQIRARVWSWNSGETIGKTFFRERIERALALRKTLIAPDKTNAMRLIHGESDGLPGLVVDRYADVLVVQFLSSGPEFWRDTLVELLQELCGFEQVYERSDVDVRQLEGLPKRTGPLRGVEPPGLLKIFENDLYFWVDVEHGHKTGFYLDQRDNRAQVGELARNRQVLDCFCYTGGFTTYTLASGADTVVAVDVSAQALELARENVRLNDLPHEKVTWLEGDVFKMLRTFRDQGRSFDLIVLDPPKFAPTTSQAQRAARGYKDINLLAFKLLRPGGFLATFSCSGGVGEDLFQKIVAGAALDAGVEARMVARLHQGLDHPVALNFPEGAYLKGLIIRIDK